MAVIFYAAEEIQGNSKEKKLMDMYRTMVATTV